MYHNLNSIQSKNIGCTARARNGRSFPARTLIQRSISAAFILLVFNCSLSFAEMIYTPDVPRIARQADFILRGRVLEGNKVRIEKEYKGRIQSKEISVPSLKKWNDLIQEQCSQEKFYHTKQLMKEAGEEAFAQLKDNGLVGSTAILFLTKGTDDNTYSLSGRTLAFRDHQFDHSAIKVTSGEKIFGFGQIKSPGPLCLILLPQDLKTIEEQIAYDRPFLVEFTWGTGYGKDEVYNYLHLSFTNLTSERRTVDLPEAVRLELVLDGETIELPREFWNFHGFGRSGHIVDAGELVNGHYELTNRKGNPPPSLKLEKGKEYKAKLTVVVEEDGVEDKYIAETICKIR